ncbi:DUF2489 domain-containing protein [Gilvimarinus sp. 1_MG-2023]|uniref:DUF2489 domain-containing protein n=1 Tax=Gilvimarinus sp. 1_MG-2023 TaxID=3062638 RepID=UPI0026E2D2F0|nr:DUF2489 domain-containing protein [Gilvimarinus sp. 1_MG-2023]MDO6745888.1 DUF2489 domain-containing protein [Gilvimarinus sp. 1_MG-2023]
MNEFPVWVLLLALFIILILTITAGIYLWKLKKLRLQQHNEIERQHEATQAQRGRVNTSIQVIAKAVGSEDITLTEASIRISMLLDSLDVDPAVNAEFSAFYQLREATSHIPFLEAWQKLDKQEKRRLTKERVAAESRHQEAVLKAAKEIIGRNF